jgi:hypothetical protein
MGRETFTWLLYQLKEGLCGLTQPRMGIDHGDILYPPKLAAHFAGSVPIIARYRDIHQLLDILCERCLFDNIMPGNIVSASAEGRVAFQIFCIRNLIVVPSMSWLSWTKPSTNLILFSRAPSSVFMMVCTVIKKKADVIMKHQLPRPIMYHWRSIPTFVTMRFVSCQHT